MLSANAPRISIGNMRFFNHPPAQRLSCRKRRA
jgi:hypothetical protein